MKWREFIVLIAGAIVTWPLAATAQEAGRTYREGILSPIPCEAPWDAIVDAERGRSGFIKGQNLTFECRDFGGNIELSSQYAAELVKAKVDVISAYGAVAIRAAQQATKTIPILGIAEDMVGEGLVDSMARPNGNTTGVSIFATELNGKRQEMRR